MEHGVVFRQIAFPVRAFDYLKAFQRRHLARTGEHLTNNGALSLILREHEQLTATVESEEHEPTRSKAPT